MLAYSDVGPKAISGYRYAIMLLFCYCKNNRSNSKTDDIVLIIVIGMPDLFRVTTIVLRSAESIAIILTSILIMYTETLIASRSIIPLQSLQLVAVANYSDYTGIRT